MISASVFKGQAIPVHAAQLVWSDTMYLWMKEQNNRKREGGDGFKVLACTRCWCVEAKRSFLCSVLTMA